MAFLLFALALVACLAIGFAFPERAPVALLAVTVLLVAMAFTQLEKFETIKGAGMEFKLRQAVEQAEKASAEAMATTEQAKVTTEAARATTAELRSAACTVARLSLTLDAARALAAIAEGDPAGTPTTERYCAVIERIGVRGPEIGGKLADDEAHGERGGPARPGRPG